MKYQKYLCVGLLVPLLACAAPFKYHLGVTAVSESEEKMVIHAELPVTVTILPGGRNWPPLFLDAAGRIYAGDIVIDGKTGKTLNYKKNSFVLPHDVLLSAVDGGFQLQHGQKKCFFSFRQIGLGKHLTALESLKNSNIDFSSGDNGLFALVTQFGKDGGVSNYRIEQFDLGRCDITFRHDFGNPDLLIEFGNSAEGGWWITGSIEQTLLQSSDGRRWRKATLPEGLGGLISAYVANSREIWLAGILAEGDKESPYLLVYSNDDGRSWRNVVADDPILDRLPVGWLEGQRRRAQQ